MSFLLDTDICSAHLKGNRAISGRFLQYQGQLHTSVLTVGELCSWTLRRRTPRQRHVALQQMLEEVGVISIDEEIAHKFGEIRSRLLDRGRVVGPVDLFIAATAQVHRLTLVTHNASDFQEIDALSLDDWLAGP